MKYDKIIIISLLTVIALILFYNAFVPENVRRTQYNKIVTHVSKYMLATYKCKSEDNSLSKFYIKINRIDYSVFNFGYKKSFNYKDASGEITDEKYEEKYNSNDNCELIITETVNDGWANPPRPEPVTKN